MNTDECLGKITQSNRMIVARLTTTAVMDGIIVGRNCEKVNNAKDSLISITCQKFLASGIASGIASGTRL